MVVEAAWITRRVCVLYLLLALALGLVAPLLPLAQIQEVVVLLAKSQQIAQEFRSSEQSQVSVHVYTLITVVVLFSPGTEFAKAPFAVSCKTQRKMPWQI